MKAGQGNLARFFACQIWILLSRSKGLWLRQEAQSSMAAFREKMGAMISGGNLGRRS